MAVRIHKADGSVVTVSEAPVGPSERREPKSAATPRSVLRSQKLKSALDRTEAKAKVKRRRVF